jgi:hypothetical protein
MKVAFAFSVATVERQIAIDASPVELVNRQLDKEVAGPISGLLLREENESET